jgi:hypothetical protein
MNSGVVKVIDTWRFAKCGTIAKCAIVDRLDNQGTWGCGNS